MKKIGLLLIIYISFGLQYTSAQFRPYKYHEILVETGLNNIYLQDLNFSPLNYSGLGLLYGIQYKRNRLKGDYFIKANYSHGKLKAAISKATLSKFQNGELQLGGHYRMPIANKKYLLKLGAYYAFNLFYVDFEEQNALTFFITHDIRPNVTFTCAIPLNQSLHIDFSFPLLTFMIRPPLTGWDEELEINQSHPLRLISNNAQLASLNHYQAFDLQLGYHYHLSDKFKLGLNYILAYRHWNPVNTLEAPFTLAQNRWQVNVITRF